MSMRFLGAGLLIVSLYVAVAPTIDAKPPDLPIDFKDAPGSQEGSTPLVPLYASPSLYYGEVEDGEPAAKVPFFVDVVTRFLNNILGHGTAEDQSEGKEEGLTLPTGEYLKHYPQMVPQSPPFPLPREDGDLEDACAMACAAHACGLDFVEKARDALRQGMTIYARRLAEEAFNPKYQVQAEASQILRSIDAEEFNQAFLATNYISKASKRAFAEEIPCMPREVEQLESLPTETEYLERAQALRDHGRSCTPATLPPARQVVRVDDLTIPEAQARTLYRIGRRREENGDLDMAKNCFEECQRVCPECQYSRQAASRVSTINLARRLDGIDSNGQPSATPNHNEWTASPVFTTPRTAVAAVEATEAKLRREAEAKSMYLVGERCRRNDDYAMAKRCYAEAMEVCPTSPYALKAKDRLTLLARLKHSDHGIGEESEEPPLPKASRKIDPAQLKEARSHFRRAEMLEGLHQTEEALHAYQQTHLACPRSSYGKRAMVEIDRLEKEMTEDWRPQSRFSVPADASCERVGIDFEGVPGRVVRHGYSGACPTQENQLITPNYAPSRFINAERPRHFHSGLTPPGTFTPDREEVMPTRPADKKKPVTVKPKAKKQFRLFDLRAGMSR